MELRFLTVQFLHDRLISPVREPWQKWRVRGFSGFCGYPSIGDGESWNLQSVSRVSLFDSRKTETPKSTIHPPNGDRAARFFAQEGFIERASRSSKDPKSTNDYTFEERTIEF